MAREEKLTEIASAGVQEYAHLVRENCKVGGAPWRVVVRGAADPDELPGQELVRRVYGVKVENAAAAREELLNPELHSVVSELPDLVRHIRRLPSSLAFECCTGELCARCVEVTQARRSVEAGWHPARCVIPLHRAQMLARDSDTILSIEGCAMVGNDWRNISAEMPLNHETTQ